MSDPLIYLDNNATTASETEPSHVLLAMGLAPEAALGTIRFSFDIRFLQARRAS